MVYISCHRGYLEGLGRFWLLLVQFANVIRMAHVVGFLSILTCDSTDLQFSSAYPFISR